MMRLLIRQISLRSSCMPGVPEISVSFSGTLYEAFDCEADHIYAVTLSAELSGSYNSAVLGSILLNEEKPGRQIHVFNSRSASVGQTLIAMKIQECEEAGIPLRK